MYSRIIYIMISALLILNCSHAMSQQQEKESLNALEHMADTLHGYQKVKALTDLAVRYQTISLSKSLYYCRMAMENINKLTDTDDFLPENNIFNEPDSILDTRALIYSVLGKCYDQLDADPQTPGQLTDAQRANKENALQYFNILLKIRKHQGNLLEIARASHAVAVPSMSLGYTERALEIYNQNIEIYQKLGNKRELAKTYNNIAYITAMDSTKIDKAISMYRVAMRFAQEDTVKGIYYATTQNMADLYTRRRNYTMATHYYHELIPYYEQTMNHVGLCQVYRQLANISSQQSDHEQAYMYLSMYTGLKDSLVSTATMMQVNELSAKYDNTQKQKEISELVITKENQRTMILVFVVVAAFALAAFLVAMLETKRKNKSNRLLSKANENILNSLNYASRLQKIIIQGERKANEILSDYFVFHRPRNIVSGDFYYVRDLGNYVALAVADCTGHGVPAAFLSVLNITFFNEVFLSYSSAPDPGNVLESVRQKVIKALNQTDDLQSSTDGMDCGLVIYNKQTRAAQYAGAYIDLYILRENGKLDEIRSTHNPVCWYFRQAPFKTTDISLQPNDVLYMFSDGYTDQIGGPSHEKFTKMRMRQTIADMHRMPLDKQKENLGIILNYWQKGNEQIDDILVLGIRAGSLLG